MSAGAVWTPDTCRCDAICAGSVRDALSGAFLGLTLSHFSRAPRPAAAPRDGRGRGVRHAGGGGARRGARWGGCVAAGADAREAAPPARHAVRAARRSLVLSWRPCDPVRRRQCHGYLCNVFGVHESTAAVAVCRRPHCACRRCCARGAHDSCAPCTSYGTSLKYRHCHVLRRRDFLGARVHCCARCLAADLCARSASGGQGIDGGRWPGCTLAADACNRAWRQTMLLLPAERSRSCCLRLASWLRWSPRAASRNLRGGYGQGL